MSLGREPAQGRDISIQDFLAYLLVGSAVLGTVTASIKGWWHRITDWLIAHQALVTDDVLIKFPEGSAGLDLSRVSILAGLAGFGVLLLLQRIRRRNEQNVSKARGRS